MKSPKYLERLEGAENTDDVDQPTAIDHEAEVLAAIAIRILHFGAQEAALFGAEPTQLA